MKSKPSFDVEIQRGDKKLCFSCSYFTSDSPPESAEDYGEQNT